ncbi:hypothetical protein OsI_26088 [Oryza sativa Indica Group]|uniref:Uncharacterized protein n=1 Tax=Oryza sativa subsp. indica TaxID=39946 RepID=B8B6D5_ORYSI|nr:hypothetical protein OsI_26088 [Oryza sativa Indica Group]
MDTQFSLAFLALEVVSSAPPSGLAADVRDGGARRGSTVELFDYQIQNSPTSAKDNHRARASTLRLRFSLLKLRRQLAVNSTSLLFRERAVVASITVEDYLVTTYGLTRDQVWKVTNSLSHLSSPCKPDAAVAFLSSLTRLSHSSIAAAVAANLRLLCADVEKNLAKLGFNLLFSVFVSKGADLPKF